MYVSIYADDSPLVFVYCGGRIKAIFIVSEVTRNFGDCVDC